MEVYSIKSQGNDRNFELTSSSFIIQKQECANPPTEPKSEKKITTAFKAKTPTVKNTSIQDYPRMTEIAHKVREKLQSIDVNIQFEVNKESGQIVIIVIDPESGEVIRKIPPEKFMKAVELLNDMKNELHAQGIEVDVKY